jgi:hypothetical protein
MMGGPDANGRFLPTSVSLPTRPRAFETACGPLGPEDVSWRKIRLLADLALVLTSWTTQQLLVEFWTLMDWPPYSLDLSTYEAHFAGERPCDVSYRFDHPTSIHCSRMGPASSRIHLQDLLLILLLPGSRHSEKKAPWLNRRFANSPTYTNQ